MARNKTTRIVLMAVSVVAALRVFGSLKAVMPLEMASMPVKAVEPLEKARRIKKSVRGAAASVAISTPVTGVSVPVKKRYRPTTSVIPMTSRKKKVGMAKTEPLSRTPRRLTSVTRKMMATANTTRYGPRSGKAETICATPDEIDTATVRI